MTTSSLKFSKARVSSRGRARCARALDQFNRDFARVLGLTGAHGHRANWRSSIDEHCDGDLVAVSDAARFLGVASKTLNNWRTTGSGPSFTKIGGRVLYRIGGLKAYIEQRSRSNTGEESQS